MPCGFATQIWSVASVLRRHDEMLMTGARPGGILNLGQWDPKDAEPASDGTAAASRSEVVRRAQRARRPRAGSGAVVVEAEERYPRTNDEVLMTVTQRGVRMLAAGMT
jgi:hypothetical protein